MKLIFLGSGSAFTVGEDNYQSNMLLESANKRLLIDCGSDVRLSLSDLGYTYADISDVYVSHLHADHVGGLEWLAFTTYFDKSCQEKVGLHIAKNLVSDLWTHVLSGGLCSLQGLQPHLNSYFSVKPIKHDGYFEWEKVHFHLVETTHSYSGEKSQPSYGLFFEVNGKNVFITTDAQFDYEQLKRYYEAADIIFHDCETSQKQSGIHAHYKELLAMPSNIRKKTWLYHYNPGPLPDAVKDGFLGFVKKGQCFEL